MSKSHPNHFQVSISKSDNGIKHLSGKSYSTVCLESGSDLMIGLPYIPGNWELPDFSDRESPASMSKKNPHFENFHI